MGFKVISLRQKSVGSNGFFSLKNVKLGKELLLVTYFLFLKQLKSILIKKEIGIVFINGHISTPCNLFVPKLHNCNHTNLGEPILRETVKTPINQIELMCCFKDLIDSQIRCNYFEDALKTFKKIKLFKLDSMNPDDVDESMANFAANHIQWEQCQNFNVLGVLCKLKSQAFHGLGKDLCRNG